jgi:MarR family 2-MHQ and catechol resistance regulon transcriptional repressor
MDSSKLYGKDAGRSLDMWIKLARAYASFSRESFHDIRTFGLTQPQFAVLDCLGHIGPMPIGELSKKMLVSGGNMTCVVDNLEREGLVHRDPSPSDRRSVVVSLTEKGRTLFEEIFPKHAERIRQIADVLTPSEQRELARLLKKLGTGILEVAEAQH